MMTKLDDLQVEASASCDNCRTPEQRSALDQMCAGICPECNNSRVPEYGTFAPADVGKLVSLVRLLFEASGEWPDATGQLRELLVWAGLYEEGGEEAAPRIPPGFVCVRCEGSGVYCEDCGSKRCVCPDGLKGVVLVCEHDRGALKAAPKKKRGKKKR